MNHVKIAAGSTVAIILLGCIGCGQRTAEVHPHTMSATEYQQNIAKINNDPNISPMNKQMMIDEFKNHVKVGGQVPGK